MEIDAAGFSENGFGTENGNTPLFSIDRVQLMFSLTDISFLTVANNVLCMSLESGKIIRIDLDHPEVVDDAELPKKSSEIGNIAGIFLDPTGSHLLITTTIGENFILNYRSKKPKPLIRLKGLVITSVAWSPTEPSRSTGAILLGTADGTVHETLIESSNEYFKREDRFIKQVWKNPLGKSITGLYAYQEKNSPVRHVLASSEGTIWYWQGKLSTKSASDLFPIYPSLFDGGDPVVEQFLKPQSECFAVAPSVNNNFRTAADHFAWLNGTGILHGTLLPEISSNIFSHSRLLLNDQIFRSASVSKTISSIVISQYHIFVQYGANVSIINHLSGKTVFHDHIELESGEHIVSLTSDTKYATYWLYTNHNIYEIRMNADEAEEIWKTFLENGEYEQALLSAKSSYAKDVVRVAYGDHMLKNRNYNQAAELLGPSSKPFEGVAIEFLDHDQNALQKFIELRLDQLGRGSSMQRVILTSWLIEIFMEKLNEADNSIAAVRPGDKSVEEEKSLITEGFKQFVENNKTILDKGTVYEIVSSHGRREELLYYANCIADTEYVLRYWVSSENWLEALKLIRQENDTRLVYKYSSVLLLNLPKDTVDTWMVFSDIDPTRLLPALLTYSSQFTGAIHSEKNQAIRYLKHVIANLKVTDAVIFNALISIYASTPTISETTLLEFLQEHEHSYYDSDFTLRICTEFNRIQCSIHIFCSIGLFEDALNLALSKNDIELAKFVADKPADDPRLRKALWLQIAKAVVESSKGDDIFRSAVQLLGQCELLTIEDLLPFFPEFTVIGKFKDELIASVETYFTSINKLNKEMENSIETGNNVQNEIENFKKRYILVEPGEQCAICNFPLATRKFYVFPCQHAFHSDCLTSNISKSGDYKIRRKVNEIEATVAKKDLVEALDSLLSSQCILCSESRVEEIDTPLVSQAEHTSDWAL